MNLRLILCTLVLLASAAIPSPGALPPDAEATTKLIGEWTTTATKGQVISRGDFAFKGDGTFSSTVDVITPDSSFRVQLEGKWSVKNSILTEEITKSSDAKRVAEGLVTRDTLLEVTDKNFRSRTESGSVESFTRH